MRTFVTKRQYAVSYEELSEKLKEIEKKFSEVYQAINYLLDKDKKQNSQEELQKIEFNK